MGKNIFKIIIFALALILFVLGIFLGNKKENSINSKKDDAISLSFIVGTDRTFCADDFLLNLNLKKDGTGVIKINSLPNEQLLYKGKSVLNGQTIPFSDLKNLCYRSSNLSSDSFSVTISNITVTVTMIPSDEKNLAPGSENIYFSTAEGLTLKENFPAYDEDGDQIQVNITEGCKKGILATQETTFTYTPFSGEYGKDSFKFSLSDSYGNYSKEYTAEINIEKIDSEHFYSDTSGFSGAYEAVKLSEMGVFSGETIGDIKLLSPEKKVDTGELLMLLNEVSGVFDVSGVCFDTGLSSDTSTKNYLKPYIKEAVETGIITDYTPDKSILKEEAYFYAAKMLGLEKTDASFPRLSSFQLITPEYIPAYARLLNEGLITYSDLQNPKDVFTRNDLVRLLYRVTQR